MMKLLKKFLVSLALCTCFFNPASAEIKIIESTGEYTIDKNLNETFDVATEHAREDARRKATEEAGIFIKSSSVMINNNLTDKVEVVAATIMDDVEPEDVRFVPIDGGKSTKIVCRIKVRVDTDKIDPDQIAGSQQQFQTIDEKNKIVAEKDAEIAKWKNLYESAVSDKQKLEIKNEFDKSQKKFLIAKYERDLNIFDFDSQINWQKVYETSQKLSELDALNPTAFRAAMYYFRKKDYLGIVVESCNRILSTNRYHQFEDLDITKNYQQKILNALKTTTCPSDTAIEAYTLLGDMNYNEFGDKARAREFVDSGIDLVKKTYSKAEIEELVNGVNVQLKDLILVGKTNTIRELYILKSEIEDCNPTFKSESKMKNLEPIYDKIYDLKYKTDW